MTNITFFIPKYRIGKSNRLRWKFNHHKKPFYFTSEINKLIRIDKLEFGNIKSYKSFFKMNFKGFYRFKKKELIK